MNPILLRAESLSKHYGGLAAVNEVSFELRKNQIQAIIGPNGAGKTTLFNMLSGNIQPTKGDIWLKEEKITDLKPHEISSRGITRNFQNIEMFNNLSVVENVMAGGYLKTRSNWITSAFHSRQCKKENEYIFDQAMEQLKLFQIDEYAAYPAFSLSYGTQRLVEIARALMLEPAILLLDEPMAGLNRTESINLLRIMRHIQERGVTILFIEHDMESVMEIADTIVVLNEGRLIAVGPPAEIQQNEEVITAYLGQEEVLC